MDGPRPLRVEELEALSALEDAVFGHEPAGQMFRMFPYLFSEANLDNLLVFADEAAPSPARIVSHVGMTIRWACLGGCTVGVACLGAVATYEAYRGQGLATRLLEAACAKAAADGADIMMISGGRGMYRRVGAADVGYDYRAVVDGPAGQALRRDDVTIAEFAEDDLADCVAAYNAKEAHFIRPAEDWACFLRSGSCMCRMARLDVVRSRGATCGRGPVCGYFIHSWEAKRNALRILEFAGEQSALAAALPLLMERQKAPCAEIHLQAGDTTLRGILAGAGAAMEPANASGTLLLLDAPRLIRRLQPYVEQRIGRGPAAGLSVAEEDGAFLFTLGNEIFRAENRAAAAEFIFGRHESVRPEGLLGQAFPAPSLWYGLNYV
ncbi:MAG: GNAT family N-acetyltransferase [Candidatus Hydrogenedentes bacterium]|nr:GNAT family N-acetyltransferase [Candidatus Hydrogenedentota bacterium]